MSTFTPAEVREFIAAGDYEAAKDAVKQSSASKAMDITMAIDLLDEIAVAKSGAGKAPKKGDKITRDEFLLEAKDVQLTNGNGVAVTLSPRQFSTGSVGFSHNGKVLIPVGNRKVLCQATVNLTVVGSKPEAA